MQELREGLGCRLVRVTVRNTPHVIGFMACVKSLPSL